MSDDPSSSPMARLAAGAVALVIGGCAGPVEPSTADLILRNGRVYTLSWGEPARDGTPATDAPRDGGWRPDATALAVLGSMIVAVGSDDDVDAYRGEQTRVVDLEGATVLPGLVDAHTHVLNLGTTLEQVDLVGVSSEREAVERVASRAAEAPPGEWLIGYGWDEGAWADDYPDKRMLTERVPDHPVLMRGLHGYAAWGNQMALERAGIDTDSAAPSGGTIERYGDGEPTGLLLNRATSLLTDAVPAPSPEQLQRRFVLGLDAMAAAGYTMVHEAGVTGQNLAALEALAADRRLPIRVYAMLSARDTDLLRRWLEWGPDTDGNDLLITRAVKAFYDGALGSRGALLLDDYSDMPGHRGVSGEDYGFDQELVTEMMAAGFQAAIHAIGDAANRETLDFVQRAYGEYPDARRYRHRIEHAQVVQLGDFRRFASLDVIASMQPPHAVEDKAWAEQRLGPERIRGAYAWRTLRRHGAHLVFSSDLPGSDHDIFYGLQAAVTRRDPELQPPGGWYSGQTMTPEEALRGYTSWAAFSAFLEEVAGTLVIGKWADVTVMDIDPLAVGESDPDRLLDGRILMTIVGGRIIYEDTRQAASASSRMGPSGRP